MSKLLGYENEIKNNNIISIQINLLNKCVSKCKSCMKYTWPDEELEVKDVCNALKILKDKYGLKSVFFSGGDPIIYKGVKEVINFCVDNDIKYSLISTLITNDEELLKLIAKTAYRVHVSLDSTDAEIYRIIRGVDGFTVADKNIKFIVANRDKNKIPVRISSTVGIFNYSEIYSLYEYAKENVCLINFYFMQTWDNLKMDEEKEQVFYDELAKIAYDEKCNKKIITNARNLILQQYNFENESEKCKRCYLPNISLVVNANGDLYPCCKLLNEHDFYKNQSENSFGNIISKTGEQIEVELNKRLNLNLPEANALCKECPQRYDGLLNDLQKIIEDKKEVLFL